MSNPFTRRSSDVDSTTASPPSRLFDAFVDERRKHVLECLTRKRTATLEQLTAWVVRREQAEPAADRGVRISLVHAHLPKLEDVGLVTYDEVTQSVELAVSGTELAPYLDLANGRDAVGAL